MVTVKPDFGWNLQDLGLNLSFVSKLVSMLLTD